MKYDSSKPVGQRVVLFRLNGKPIDDTTVYHIATNSFLADGGDGFVAFTEGQGLCRIPGGPQRPVCRQGGICGPLIA